MLPTKFCQEGYSEKKIYIKQRQITLILQMRREITYKITLSCFKCVVKKIGKQRKK